MMDLVELMAQFVVLWDAVHQIQLTNTSDQIFWKWIANGVYTAKSAYLAQLKGTYCSFDADAIWHAHAEGKHRFFAWLLVQEKILTADKLAARNWPSFTNCVFFVVGFSVSGAIGGITVEVVATVLIALLSG